jgi:hypothetical protein
MLCQPKKAGLVGNTVMAEVDVLAAVLAAVLVAVLGSN